MYGEVKVVLMMGRIEIANRNSYPKPDPKVDRHFCKSWDCHSWSM